MTSAIPNEHVRLAGSFQEGEARNGLFSLAFQNVKHDFAGFPVGFARLHRPTLQQNACSLFRAAYGPETTSPVFLKGDGLRPTSGFHNAVLRDAKLATQRVISRDVPLTVEVSGRARP